jgi:hypothetical protein
MFKGAKSDPDHEAIPDSFPEKNPYQGLNVGNDAYR